MKLTEWIYNSLPFIVASHAGAWIETGKFLSMACRPQVASHAGAWIETFIIFPMLHIFAVAPYAGAWIETGGMGYCPSLIIFGTVVRGTEHRRQRTENRQNRE